MKLTVQLEDQEHVFTLDLMKFLKLLGVDKTEEEVQAKVISEIYKI